MSILPLFLLKLQKKCWKGKIFHKLVFDSHPLTDPKTEGSLNPCLYACNSEKVVASLCDISCPSSYCIKGEYQFKRLILTLSLIIYNQSIYKMINNLRPMAGTGPFLKSRGRATTMQSK